MTRVRQGIGSQVRAYDSIGSGESSPSATSCVGGEHESDGLNAAPSHTDRHGARTFGPSRRLAVGLSLWATLATLAAVVLAARSLQPDGRDSSSSLAASPAATAEAVGGLAPRKWCLPNAVHQTFSGVILKEDDELMPQGKWHGHLWWYHDEITNGFHIQATIGGDTFGFWDLSTLGSAGRTEYRAAYKGDVCLHYEEHVASDDRFGEEDMCRGSAWAGNVTFQGAVKYGYETEAERWLGIIPESNDARSWGLPPGTESLIDFQRSPTNEDEVRLLYHRVVAPTQGVLGWAGGDSVAFDLVFTGVESMAETEVLNLVKVPAICEVMAGEFHDEQARGITSGDGGDRRLRRTTKSEASIAGNGATASVVTPAHAIGGIILGKR